MAARVFEIPLNAGQNESIDRALLPDGVLRLLQNARLSRDGRIEVRPSYTALGVTLWVSGGANIVPRDLATYEDRLLAFGSRSGDTVPYSTQIFSYLGEDRADWKGQFDLTTGNYGAFPFVSDLQIEWQAPTGSIATSTDIAYASGFVCAVSTDPAASISKVFVLKDGVPVCTLSITSARSSRVIALGGSFVLLTRKTDGDIEIRDFNVLSSYVWSSATTLISNLATGTFSWDVCPVVGTTDFILAYPDPANTRMTVMRIDASFATDWTTQIAVTPGNMAVCADFDSNVVGFVHVDGSNDAQLYSLVISTGSVSDGPTNILGPGAGTPDCVGTPAIQYVSTTRFIIECSQNTGSTVGSQSSQRATVGHALAAETENDDVLIASKLFTQTRDSTSDLALGIGSVPVQGNISGTDQLYGTTIQAVQDGFILAARWNYAYSSRMNDFRVTNYHGRSSVATDGSGTFWAAVSVLDADDLTTTNGGTLQVVRFKSGVQARRQSAEMQGALYVAGGFVGYYDGTNLVEGGFLDTPAILGYVEGTTGSLTALGTYNYVACYEWTDAKGRLHRSTPSNPREITLTGANDDLTLTVTSAHSLRRVDALGTGQTVKTVIYRANPDDSVFYRVGSVENTAGTTGYADTLEFLDTMSDVAAEDEPVLYVQSQKPIVNVGYYPCRFIAAGRDRLIMGGLPDPYMIAFSQLPFPGEPMEGADVESEFAYQARLPEHVTAVSGFGDSYVAFTASGIYQIPGEGPQRNGTGEFFTPRAIYSDGGCIDWRSVVDTAQGLFFQMATDKIYRLTPAGELDFVGRRVQDTLASYPVVTGAALCTETQRVVFAVQNVAGDEGGLLSYDLIHDAWSFDDLGVIDAVVEYGGRVAYLQSSVVYVEDSVIADGAGALPTVSVRLGSIRLFSALGQGDLCKVGLLMTYLGDCTVEGFISYDDGKTWTSMGSQAVTAAAVTSPETGNPIASGDPHSIIFTPKRRSVDRFALRFDVSNATNSGGVRMHVVSLEAEAQEFSTRKPARDQR